MKLIKTRFVQLFIACSQITIESSDKFSERDVEEIVDVWKHKTRTILTTCNLIKYLIDITELNLLFCSIESKI